MNPVLVLTHNCLELTQRCVDSVRKQDIATEILILDNGSTDGTKEWLEEQDFQYISYKDNLGVSHGWNTGLEMLFNLQGTQRANHVLVLNNDVTLPPWFYGELIAYQVPFLTGVQVNSIADLPANAPMALKLIPHPDFSCFLIGRQAWEKIGPFDEGMKFYAQDCDYHVRASAEGFPLFAAPAVPFYHERSSTLKNAPLWERVEIERQADADRAYFLQKWGFSVGSEEYQRATGAVKGTALAFPGEER